MAKLYWNKIKKNQQLEKISFEPITKVQIARFASAANDFNPLHIDDSYANDVNFGGICAHNLITAGFAEQALREEAENGYLLSFSSQFHKIIRPLAELYVSGKIIRKYEKNKEPRIDIEITVKNQNHEITAIVLATMILWRNESEEKKAETKLPIPSKFSQKEYNSLCNIRQYLCFGEIIKNR